MEYVDKLLCHTGMFFLEGASNCNNNKLSDGGTAKTFIEESEEEAEDDALFVVQDPMGTEHFVRKVVTCGWLHRRQESSSWLSGQQQRSWDPNWVNLVLAQTHAKPWDQPILLIYSHRHAMSPSLVLPLQNSIILPVNTKDVHLPSTVGFEVRPTDVTEACPDSARVFLADTKRARDAWVYALSRSLLQFEKGRLKSEDAPQSPPRDTLQQPQQQQRRNLQRTSTNQLDTLTKPITSFETANRSRSSASSTASSSVATDTDFGNNNSSSSSSSSSNSNSEKTNVWSSRPAQQQSPKSKSKEVQQSPPQQQQNLKSPPRSFLPPRPERKSPTSPKAMPPPPPNPPKARQQQQRR